MKSEKLSKPELEHQNNHTISEICANCGATLIGDYCHKCGEKPLSHHDLSVKHFVLHTVVYEFTHLNGSIFQTLKLLVTKPGFLAEEYFSGRMSRYLNPLRLYLTLSLVFFFASSHLGRQCFDQRNSEVGTDRIFEQAHVGKSQISRFGI